MIKINFFFLIFSILDAMTSITAERLVLSFNDHKEFTIMQWTDLHFCETEENDILTHDLQLKLIDFTNPDLIVITGDAISNLNYQIDPTDNYFQVCWEKMTEAINSRNKPYAYVFGQSENFIENKKLELIALENSNPNSMLVDSIQNTHGSNYYIPIQSKLNVGKYSAVLWMFDSNGNCYEQKDSWPCINDQQIDWFYESYTNIKNSLADDPLNFAFMHIPLPEFKTLYNTERIYGSRNEFVSCPLVNSGFFEDVAVDYTFTAIFAGHNHGNDFKGRLNDVELAYGRKTGYGGYTIEGMKNGARIIKLKEMKNSDGSAYLHYDSYIVDEDKVFDMQVHSFRGSVEQDECTYSMDKILEEVTLTKRILLLVLALVFIAFFMGSMYILWKKGFLGGMFREKGSTVELEALKNTPDTE